MVMLALVVCQNPRLETNQYIGKRGLLLRAKSKIFEDQKVARFLDVLVEIYLLKVQLRSTSQCIAMSC